MSLIDRPGGKDFDVGVCLSFSLFPLFGTLGVLRGDAGLHAEGNPGQDRGVAGRGDRIGDMCVFFYLFWWCRTRWFAGGGIWKKENRPGGTVL